MHCANCRVKIKGRTVDLAVFHHGTMKFLNEGIWPCLTAQLQLLLWMQSGSKGEEIAFCLLRNRSNACLPPASNSRTILLVHHWHLYMPRLNMLIMTVY